MHHQSSYLAKIKIFSFIINLCFDEHTQFPKIITLIKID